MYNNEQHITPPPLRIDIAATPFLSIIIPVYNVRSRDIRRCLDSIYSEDSPEDEFEVICVNDCSTEISGLETIADYSLNGHKPTNIRVIKTSENVRQGGARNLGMSVAKGTTSSLLIRMTSLPPVSCRG